MLVYSIIKLVIFSCITLYKLYFISIKLYIDKICVIIEEPIYKKLYLHTFAQCQRDHMANSLILH